MTGNEADPWEFDRQYPLYGIPLTEEICELNGWKDGLVYPHCRLAGFESGCVAAVDEDSGDFPIILADVRTVDQLQRYLRTQGIRGVQTAKTMKI